MAVSVGAKPARAKATPVSRERFVMPAGHGGAWPDNEPTRRTTHQRPGATGVEGAGGSGGHGRASRSTLPSLQARVWRSRGRPGPTAPGTPAEPQATSSIANSAAPPARRAQEGQAAVPVGGGAWPRCRWVAAGPDRGAGGWRQGLAGLRDDAPSHTPATQRRRRRGRRRDRRAWLQRPWVAGPGRGAGGWRQGQGGPRDRPLRAQLACGDLAGGPPPTGTHSGPAPQAAQERCAA